MIAGDTVFVEVGGGGRYDKLVKHFVPHQTVGSVPATGFAFGVERLVELLDHLGLLHSGKQIYTSIGLHGASAETLMTPGLTPEGYLSAVRVAANDRATGHAVDIYLGEPAKAQHYAVARGIKRTVSCEP